MPSTEAASPPPSPPLPSPTLPRPDPAEVRRIVLSALDEDLGPGDLTSESAVPAAARGRGAFVARQAGVAAGLWLIREVAAAAATLVGARGGGDPAHAAGADADAGAGAAGGGEVEVEVLAREGAGFEPGAVLARIAGPARVLLAAERVTLNLIQRLAGVAGLTRRYVDAVEGTGARIVDTRKTTPGLRALEKYAVRCGGGANHRMGLYDEAMLKDNHVAVLAAPRGLAPGEVPLAAAVAAIRARRPGARVTVEVDGLAALERALESRADIVLLDNFPLADLRAAVRRAASVPAPERPLLEASGGVRLDTVRAIAATGVDRVSVGALTHQAVNVDLGLDFELALEHERGAASELSMPAPGGSV